MVQPANKYVVDEKTVYLFNKNNEIPKHLKNKSQYIYIGDESTHIKDESKTGKIANKLMAPIAFLQPKTDAKKSLLDKPKQFLAFNDEIGRAAAEKIITKAVGEGIKAVGKGKESLITATIIAAFVRGLLLVTSPVWILPFSAGYKIADLILAKPTSSSNDSNPLITIQVDNDL